MAFVIKAIFPKIQSLNLQKIESFIPITAEKTETKNFGSISECSIGKTIEPKTD
jgi:hypothetical protein